MAACSVSKECCYLKSVLQELQFPNEIQIYCDSTAALSMILNPVQRQKAKHFNVQYHWVRECHKTGRLMYYHLEGVKQPADMFTKALCHDAISEVRRSFREANTHTIVLNRNGRKSTMKE